MENVDKRVLKVLKSINSIGNFENSSNFLVDGLVDSLDIIRLITLLETEFEISINALDIVPENFDSIKNITKLIKQKIAIKQIYK
ncbi:acyl carrier protein [Aliarcobacter cryaerophilus]|uniref:acyl carrier protein n=1 Tax=Aliarcobacter cryaerophilus TaxID=28198 RepID=UPI00112EFE5D|nr:acyl carrier protein [Aliarcobacter cryaerophilus]